MQVKPGFVHAFKEEAGGRGRQNSEFEDNLFYKASPGQPVFVTQRNPVLKKRKIVQVNSFEHIHRVE